MFREEKDSMGSVQVPKDTLWGAQTQRSLNNFAIGKEKMPNEIIEEIIHIKKAAASVNYQLGSITKQQKTLITISCDELLSSAFENHFPLSVWQTGSGTQSNMNVNEVVANLANAKENHPPGSYEIVHPNDHINCSQSTNDTFPTAIHMATLRKIELSLFPSVRKMISSLHYLQTSFENIIKSGRTHLMDASPISLDQEFSGYVSQLEHALDHIEFCYGHVQELPIGGTAVGTGINTKTQYIPLMIQELNKLHPVNLKASPCRFESMGSKDALVAMHGALKQLAVALFKIANDIRWMGSGPRCGLSELFLPANEPGSSIMPGKVNPTQCEALLMVCMQVMGNDSTLSIAGSQGNFELNVTMPLFAHLMMQSLQILSDSCTSFTNNCLEGLKANKDQCKLYIENSLMLATKLNTHIGYDKASQIVKYAHNNNTSLKEAALHLKLLRAEEFDQIIQPKTMLSPQD